MRTTIFALFSLILISVQATNGYKLKMNVLLNGKVVSSPQVIVQEGHKATLTQEDSKTNVMTEISVLASQKEIKGNKGILLDLEIAHIIDQERKIVSRPKVLVSEGKEALFETIDSNSDEKLQLKVITTKVSL